MSEFKYTETEQQFNYVLNHQSKELSSIKSPDMATAEACISESEALLKELGISIENLPKVVNPTPKRVMVVPSWEELCNKAEQEVGSTTDLESLFTDEELRMNQDALRSLNADYNNIYKLDKIDITICAAAGILGAVVDILLIGIPQKTPEGLKGGPLSNYVRDWFNQRFPEEEMEKLANSKVSKVSFDAQDNRHTTEYVTGLSAYYHRLLSLGHDPILGLIFGVYDILNGKMTTIDKTGKIVSQVMETMQTEKKVMFFLQLLNRLFILNLILQLLWDYQRL